jgi:hypothetical protein
MNLKANIPYPYYRLHEEELMGNGENHISEKEQGRNHNNWYRTCEKLPGT